MFEDIFSPLQAAVDLVPQSPHPDNKIAATLFTDDWSVSRTNYWPACIEQKIGREAKIGNSSGTIHAETACILNAPGPVEEAALSITDPFCPNCAKNIAEAGIMEIYLDHKGFDKDFFKRRGGDFENMSLRICAHAGISVFKLWREEQKIEIIYEPPEHYTPPEDSPIIQEEIKAASEDLFKQHIAQAAAIHQRRKFSLCFAKDADEKIFCLTARAHAVTGYTMTDPEEALDLLTPIGKYSFIQEPVNRMLMVCARKGLDIMQNYFYCSQIPTSREQVNLVGAGIKRITIGDFEKSRDRHGRKAMKQLSKVGIIKFT